MLPRRHGGEETFAQHVCEAVSDALRSANEAPAMRLARETLRRR
jgi:hypothetical protein